MWWCNYLESIPCCQMNQRYYLLSGCILAFVFFCISGTKFGSAVKRLENWCFVLKQKLVPRGGFSRQQLNVQAGGSEQVFSPDRLGSSRICHWQNSCGVVFLSAFFLPLCYLYLCYFISLLLWNLASFVCIWSSSCPPPVWQEGAILVFLPGWDGISSLNDLLMAQQMFRSGIHEGCAHALRHY